MPLPTEILEQVSEEYRDHPSLKEINDIAGLAKSYVETKAMVGNSVRIPSKDAGPQAYEEYLNKIINNDPTLMLKPDFAKPEQSHEFFRTIGLPEDFSKYQNPEDMKLPQDVEAEMRELLYSAQAPQSVYAKVMAAFSDRQNQMETLNTDTHERDLSSLKDKWGQATDDRIAAAKRANDEFYPGRDFDVLTGKERESLYNISSAMTGKGPQAVGQQSQIPSDVMTPDEAREQAAEIMTRLHDPNNGLTREDSMALVRKRIKMLVDYAGYEGTLDSLKA